MGSADGGYPSRVFETGAPVRLITTPSGDRRLPLFCCRGACGHLMHSGIGTAMEQLHFVMRHSAAGMQH
jgi:hypothetical protein